MWLTAGALLAGQTTPPAAKKPAAAKPAAPSRADAEAVSKLLKEGEQARAADQIDAAIEIYQKIVKLAPRNPEPWWYLGMCFYEKDRFAEAEPAFRQVAALDKDNGSALTMLGLAEYENKKYADSLRHLLAATSAKMPLQRGSQMDKVARFHIIALMNLVGQHDIGSVILQEFATENRETPDLVEAAGVNLLRLTYLPKGVPEDKKEAVNLAGTAVILAWHGKVKEGQALVAELLEKYPNLPNAHYLMGYMYILQNDPKSIEELEKELTVSPRHVAARLQIAQEYMKMGEAEKGLKYAQEATALAPQDFMAFQILGRVQLDAGNLPEAIKSLETAVKLVPECLQCHSVLANAYARSGRQADAERQMQIRAELAKGQAAQPIVK